MFSLLFQILPVFVTDVDHQVALWFHAHLTNGFADILIGMSDPGSAECVGPVTGITALLLAWKRFWRGLMTLGLVVPGGMLINEVMKITIQRSRPFQTSPYIDVTGYSFPSAHTMAAALLYGLLAMFAVSIIKNKWWQLGAVVAAFCLVLTVAFSRVALGAHYVTDVMGAMAVSAVWLSFCFNAVRKMHRDEASVEVEAEREE